VDRESVLRHGELADVVKERGRLDALDFLVRQAYCTTRVLFMSYKDIFGN
jgi:hypothetical protein